MTARRTSLIRSAGIAAWLCALVVVACYLLQIALGDLVENAARAKTYVFADMTEVMTFIKVPLHPLLAFGLLFAALTAAVFVVALLWRGLLRALGAEELDTVVTAGLMWTLKRQVLTVWLLVSLLLTGAMLLAVNLPLGFAGVAVLLFCIYCMPVLVLRPRWLGSESADQSWRPSGAALAAYLVLMGGSLGLGAATGAVGMGMVSPVFQSLGFCLEVWLGWLAASALITVRSHQELWPHLASRFQRRFVYLVVVAIARPLQVVLVWLLPPLLLIGVYAIFIAPTVQEVSAHLPPAAVALHKMVSRATNTMADYWYLLLIPALVTATYLYVGRCLVLFDGHVLAGTESAHSGYSAERSVIDPN